MGTPDPPLITEEYQRRLDEGREKALKDGRVMFRPPFGYKVVDGKLVVDEEKRALIVKILKDIDGGWKTRDIVSQNGVVAALVRRIRNNPIYRTGEVRYAGEVVFKVEPILPKGGKQ